MGCYAEIDGAASWNQTLRAAAVVFEFRESIHGFNRVVVHVVLSGCCGAAETPLIAVSGTIFVVPDIVENVVGERPETATRAAPPENSRQTTRLVVFRGHKSCHVVIEKIVRGVLAHAEVKVGVRRAVVSIVCELEQVVVGYVAVVKNLRPPEIDRKSVV